MGKINLNPYLFFSGNCEEAMEFYKSVLGGELTISYYEEGPVDAHAEAKANAEKMKGKVMHAMLEGELKIMASDSPFSAETVKTGQISLSLGGEDEQKLTKIFEALADGGTIKSPLKKEFWGDTFGMLTDKFGIDWMINIGKPQQ